MIAALIQKELREHGLVLLASALLSAVALAGMLVLGKEGGGRFTALVTFCLSLGLLNALVTANRLLVREYAGRTQLFLEVLPIGRARVFFTKWLLGAAWLAALTSAAWLATLRHQRTREVIPLGDALDVLVAVLAFTLTAWSFAAMAGMLGRHRYTVWLSLLFILGVAADVGELSPEDIPVFRLVGDRTMMARGAAPLPDMLWALGVGTACAIGAAALALVGSGAMASALARRMTARERVFTLVAALVAGFVYTAVEGKRAKPAFDVADATYVQGQRARVGIMATADMAVAQQLELATAIARDVDTLLARLGALQAKPAIYVMPQKGLDQTVIERAELSGASGIVLRAAPDVPSVTLRGHVLHDVLADYTLRRGLREDRHILLDGLASFAAVGDDGAARQQALLRFAHAPLAIDARLLTRWEETSERLGRCYADALAFAVVERLAVQLGQAKLDALMRELFARPKDDVRVLLEPAPAELLARAGTSWVELARRTAALQASERERNGGLLARIPERGARILSSRSAQRGIKVEAEVKGATQYRVLYSALGPWTRTPHPLTRLDVRGAHDAPVVRATLPVSQARGTRLFAAVELDDEILGCPIRIHGERLVLP
jgi:hypothetical protein